jgi:hypothetical protein
MTKFMFVAAILVIAMMGSNAFANGAPAAEPAKKAEAAAEEKKGLICGDAEKLVCVAVPKCTDPQSKADAEKRSCEERKGKYVAETCSCDLSQVNNPLRDYERVAFCDVFNASGKIGADGIREVNVATLCAATERLTANARWEASERKKIAATAAKLREELEGIRKDLEGAASTDEVEKVKGRLDGVEGALAAVATDASYAKLAVEELRKQLEELKKATERKFADLESRIKGLEDGHSDQEKRLTVVEAIVAELKKSKLGFGFSALLALQPEVAKGLIRARGGNAFALQPAFLLAVGQTRLTIEFGRVAEQGHAPDKSAASYWGNVGGVSAAYLFQPVPNLGLGPALGLRVKATNSTLAFSNARAIGTTLNFGAAFEWAISDTWRLNAGIGFAYEWNRASFDGVEQVGSGWAGAGSLGVGYYF